MNTPTTTKKGTPCSTNWNKYWIAYVEYIETELDRRICGARTRTGDCCTMEPTHPNGRCRFHGGVEAYGGKEGNAHALRHGLYSFRLRPCSVKCPMWNKCPFAGDDVMQLHERDRPACVYEQQEYDDALAEVTAMAAAEEDDGPETIAACDSLTRSAGPYAMARVMTLRASMALAEESLVNVRHVDGELPHSRVSGHAEVFLRLDRAQRAREHHITQAAATIARTRQKQAEREAEMEGGFDLALEMQELIEEEERLERLAKEQAEAETQQADAAPANPAPDQQPAEKSGLSEVERGMSETHGPSHSSDLIEDTAPSPPSPPSPLSPLGPSTLPQNTEPSSPEHEQQPPPRQPRARSQRPTRPNPTRKRPRIPPPLRG